MSLKGSLRGLMGELLRHALLSDPVRMVCLSIKCNLIVIRLFTIKQLRTIVFKAEN